MSSTSIQGRFILALVPIRTSDPPSPSPLPQGEGLPIHLSLREKSAEGRERERLQERSGARMKQPWTSTLTRLKPGTESQTLRDSWSVDRLRRARTFVSQQ